MSIKIYRYSIKLHERTFLQEMGGVPIMKPGNRVRTEPESGERERHGTDYFSRGREQCISVLVCCEAAEGRSVLRGSSNHSLRSRRGCGDKTRHHHRKIHTGETIRNYNGRAGGESSAEMPGACARLFGLGDLSPKLAGIYGNSL